MKRLVLIKQSPLSDVAHLYEHLFCMAVNRFFAEKKLFQYVDYSLVGKTYETGIISIDIEFYSDDAVSLIENIKELTISEEQDDILNVITQLVAEEEKIPVSGGIEELLKEIRVIADSDWVSLDEFGLLIEPEIDSHKGSFYFSDDASRPANPLSVEIGVTADFAKNHTDLLPLIHEFSRLIVDNIMLDIPIHYGSYSFNDEFVHNAQLVGFANDFRVADTDHEYKAADIAKTTKHVVETIRESGGFERFVNNLRQLSMLDAPNHVPNFEIIHHNTKVMIGSAGWNEIATDENTKEVLDNLEVIVTFGPDRIVETIFS